MQLRINATSPLSVREAQEPGEGVLADYEPVFFKETEKTIAHTGPTIVSMKDDGTVVDIASVTVDGKTGRIRLRRQSLEAVVPPIDNKEKGE
jgi:hypothetical protein